MAFTITYENKSDTFEKKVKLLDLTNGNKDYICALVNGQLRELDYDVYYDANVEFLTLKDHDAMGIYERSLRFIFTMASHLVIPGIKFRMTYSVSRTIYAQLIQKGSNKELYLTPKLVKQIEEKMHEIVKADYPFLRLIKTNEEAKEIYEDFNNGSEDYINSLKRDEMQLKEELSEIETKLQNAKEFTEKLNDIKEAKQKRNEKIKIDIE